jgi:hypothetical protein
MLEESDLNIPLYISGRRALVMEDLGGWPGFGEEAGRVAAEALVVQGPNFEFGVVRPKIRSVRLMDGYYFKEIH